MLTSLFDFELPERMIAASPVEPRDSAKMLVVDNGQLTDRIVRDLVDYLNPEDILVFNDTKVIPARLFGKRSEAKIELLLHKNKGDIWQCFAKPAKKLKEGDVIEFAPDFFCEVISKDDDGQVIVKFPSGDFINKLEKYGQMPLPPYIEKKRHADNSDNKNYQTIYAKNEGSVAAPTAGLHFTDEMLKAIERKGIKKAFVTLHVGGGTFLPVKSDDTSEHKMHSEFAQISKETAEAINRAKKAGGRVIAVGTTSVRTLESAADENGLLKEFSAETNIFITPGYKFKIVGGMLTNFHLPKSTLFMLVSAFSGLEAMQSAYKHAIENNYRFYSYGDACLLI